MNTPLFDAVLQMGDDCLVLAQRLCEWSGSAPTIEVDLSLSNIGLDLLGQATLLLDYAGAIEGRGRSADRLAFHRDPEAFRNALLVEQPNGDFARTVARQLYYSAYSHTLFELLATSSDARLAEISAKAAKEARYHLDYAREWTVRLGDGTAESRQRLLAGLDWLARFVPDLFAWNGDVLALSDAGVFPHPDTIRQSFGRIVSATLAEATVTEPEVSWPTTGGRLGRHSEHLSPLLAVMQVLPRAHPEAAW